MAPIFKTSLALLSVSAALLSSIDGVSAKKHNHNYGRHMKMAKRGSLFEDLSKRADELAPFGYDRCGVARSKPYVKKPSASPQPSSKWKPCPPGTPAYEAAQAEANGEDDGEDNGDDEAVTTTSSYYDDGKNYKVEVITGTGSATQTGAEAALGNVDAGKDASSTAAPVSTWVPESSSATSAPAAVPTPSESSSWSESSSSSWTPEPAPSSSSSSDDIPVASPKTKVNLVKPVGGWGEQPAPSSSSKEVAAPAPSPQTPAPPTQDGRGMLGVSWDWLNPGGALQNWAGAKRVYTWSAFPPSDPLPAGMEWYPQYWGPGKQGDFEAQVARGIIKPGMTILGYNEPDQAGQANLGIQDGINSYLAQITPYADQGYRLATPGCTSDDNGFNWIKGFVDGCAGRCKFSVLQTHYYGTDADKFIAYIQNLYDTFGLPIIVSEYSAETFGNGPELSVGEVHAYVQKTQDWLKAQSFVESYFYFGPITSGQMGGVNLNNQMISDSGAINDLGWQYLNTGK